MKILNILAIMILTSATAALARANPFMPFVGEYKIESSYCAHNGEPLAEGCEWVQVKITTPSEKEACIEEIKADGSVVRSCLKEYRSDSSDRVPGVGYDARFVGSATEARWTYTNTTHYYAYLKSYYLTIRDGQMFLAYKEIEKKSGEVRAEERIHTLR